MQMGYYDKAWEFEWADMKKYSPVSRHTRRWVFKMLRKVGSVESIADIGCGDGSFLSQARCLYPNASLLGSDLSTTSVEICRKRIPGGSFVVCDITREGNPFGQIVDVGISSEVIEHVTDDVLAVKNMARFCRYLILTVPGGTLDKTSRRMGHLRHYSESALRSLVERGDLDAVFCRTWGYPFAYPLYAKLRDLAGYSVITGEYGPFKRILCHLLYAFFHLNDLFSGGNKIFILARNRRLNG